MSAPNLVVGSELGIRETGNLQFLYCFSNLRVIEQVGRNILRIGIDFREETEPQYHHALVGDRMRSELREFYEGEMQALDDLIAVLIVHDAVVVDEIRSIMRKDIIYQVERIHWLQFAVFTSLLSESLNSSASPWTGIPFSFLMYICLCSPCFPNLLSFLCP